LRIKKDAFKIARAVARQSPHKFDTGTLFFVVQHYDCLRDDANGILLRERAGEDGALRERRRHGGGERKL
jgi:hypothetical protein